uniref:Myb/SANT-like DNA-binding domain-containing protein n=1 Tax=Anopheles atroparvus TaxID=41427 RepID=A0A182IMU8_ANOAO
MTTTSSSPVEAGGSVPRAGRVFQKQRTPSEGTDSGGSRETWISTNKILNSSLCGRRTNSRNPNFDYDETKLLIQLWGDPQVQKTLITTHKKHPVIAELAQKMRAQGYSRSTEEINTRIKNLKCFYNRIKKDMAAGIINQTTWRHYAEMDEIISRPVFGNAHRLHMMQQQKGQDQQQSGATGGNRGRKAMTSDEGEEDSDDIPLDQFPVKLEVMSDDDDDEATEIRAEDLLTIDANEFNDGLDELLLKAQAKGGSGTASTAKPSYGLSNAPATSKPSNSCGLVIETISSANGTTINAATSSAGSTPVTKAGKISVVPTNLLMKQPTVSTNMTTPIQIYTQPTVSLASTSMMSSVGVTKVTTAGKVGPGGTLTTNIGPPGSTGVTPMKLLLVNTVAKDGTTKQILTPASEVPAMSQLNYHHPTNIPLSLPAKSPIVNIPTVNVPTKVGMEQPPKVDGARKTGQSAGFKTLLTQLVAIQRENLAINQERLTLEKERIEFEKQFGGSLVSMVRNMSSFFTGMLQHQRKEFKANDDRQQRVQEQAPQALMKKPEDDKQRVAADPLAQPGTTNGTAMEEGNDSSSQSPTPASDPLQATTARNKRRSSCSSSSEATAEKPPNRTPPKESEPSASVPSVKQTSSPSQPSSSSDVLPKKRRMMTRNSTQLSQVPPPRLSSTEEALKTEVISDNDER